MKKIYVFIICLLGITSLQAQDCIPGNNVAVLTTQAEVDNFVATYAGTCDFIGGLTIGSFSTSNSITDISGLSFLTGVDFLYMNNLQALSSFAGLENIQTAIGITFCIPQVRKS